jgi:hypothetical protein
MGDAIRLSMGLILATALTLVGLGCGGGSDSGAGSTPGKTACGPTATCTSYPKPPTNQDGQPFCCVLGVSTGDPESQTCHDGNLAACESGIPIYCDEAADCDPGLHCCEQTIRTEFACTASCGVRLQLCGTDPECENGQPCTPYVCDGEPLSTCGALGPSEQSGLGCVPAP